MPRRDARPHMYESGRYVADHVAPTAPEQVQPNGVDLTLDAVFEQTDAGHIGREGTEIGAREELSPSGDPPTYTLSAGGYVVRYGETIRIPEGHVGFLYPRSSLLRNGCMLDTAVWDAGYEGKGEGLLEVYHEITIERDARIAQLVLAAADHADTYDGSYQGENL
ncbi:MAG: deoxyuridine 5'-triphosphate nucleotidohydrolase [Halobacteriaceae archaeon]